MSTNGETADLMVREGIQITESALKLAGLGAKNLAALLIALANDNQKLAGKTNLKRLIHDGEELTIFSVKQEDLKGFQMEAKRYGVLFYPIVNKVEKTGTVEIMAKAKDAKQINRIFERMGYPAPVKEDTAAKKENARAPSENSSKERGTGARASTEPAAEKAAEGFGQVVRGTVAHGSFLRYFILSRDCSCRPCVPGAACRRRSGRFRLWAR